MAKPRQTYRIAIWLWCVLKAKQHIFREFIMYLLRTKSTETNKSNVWKWHLLLCFYHRGEKKNMQPYVAYCCLFAACRYWIAEVLPNWEDMSNRCDKIQLALLWLVVLFSIKQEPKKSQENNVQKKRVVCYVELVFLMLFTFCMPHKMDDSSQFHRMKHKKKRRRISKRRRNPTQVICTHVVFLKSYTGARKFAHYWNY